MSLCALVSTLQTIAGIITNQTYVEIYMFFYGIDCQLPRGLRPNEFLMGFISIRVAVFTLVRQT